MSFKRIPRDLLQKTTPTSLTLLLGFDETNEMGQGVNAPIKLTIGDIAEAHDHDDLYYRKAAVDILLSGKSDTSHTHTFASLTSKPTTLAGYGISDAYTSAAVDALLAGKSDTSHTHTFASLTSKPTTISGYGITNAYTKTDVDTLLGGYSVTGHTHTFASLTSKPTTLAGYGIADAYTSAAVDALLTGYSVTSHTHTFSSLTSKPTTLSGYGITDAYTKTQIDTTFSGYYTSTTVDGLFATNNTYVEYANTGAFPATGVAGRAYLSKATNLLYRWNGSAYVIVSPAGVATSIDWADVFNTPTTLSGYGITDAYTDTQVDTLLTGKSDTGHTHTFASLTSKPTTLAGYSISDAYTSSQVDTLLAGYLTNITGLVTQGTNVTITGLGTSGSPYVINASGGGSSDYDTLTNQPITNLYGTDLSPIDLDALTTPGTYKLNLESFASVASTSDAGWATYVGIYGVLGLPFIVYEDPITPGDYVQMSNFGPEGIRRSKTSGSWVAFESFYSFTNLGVSSGDLKFFGSGAGSGMNIITTANTSNTDYTNIIPAKSGTFAMLDDITTGVTDGDKGDITVSGTGATWTIDNGAVTLAKMANMATASLIYRKTAGTGAPEVQTLATLKTDLGLTGTNSGDQTTITGNAGSATVLQTGRTIGMTGDVTWTSPSFDGSGNVTAAATVTRINGTALSGLATGILKNTTGTGVPSIAVAGDFPTLNQNTTGSAATLTTTRTIWGQNFNGSANVTGALTAVTDITGGASSMTITAGTGNSRTLTLMTTTSGGVATAALTLSATQTVTFGGTAILGSNSITMTGSIAATGARVTKGWFTDIESTNMITIGGTSLTTVAQTLQNKTMTNSNNVLGGVTMTLGSDATGDIYYRSAGGVLTRLGVGSNGNVLTLASGLPSWAAPAGGGAPKEIRIRIPGELIADTSNFQGVFWKNNTGGTITITNVRFEVAKAAAGSPAIAFNIYKSSGTASDGINTSATALFTSAVDLVGTYSSATNVPNTTTVAADLWVSARITSSSGSTNKAADAEIIISYT